MSPRKLLAYSRIFYEWRLKGTTRLDYPPEDISIELTNTCNFKCAFCPQSDPEHFDRVARTSLSPGQADRILGKLRAGGVKTDVIHWTLDGEPFINRDIDRICEAALRHGFRVFNFATNGYYLSPDRLASLPSGNGADYTLCVDFCANEEYFEQYRGTKTSWRRVRDNIRGALENDAMRHIRFRITDISSFTVEERDELEKRMDSLRALFPSGRIDYDSRVFHNMAGFLPGMIEKKKKGRKRYYVCPYPWSSLVVASNGDVVACCRDLEHKSVLGNLFEQDLPEIWNGNGFLELRRNLVQKRPDANGACRQCDLPYDAAKLSLAHMIVRGVHRLGIFK